MIPSPPFPLYCRLPFVVPFVLFGIIPPLCLHLYVMPYAIIVACSVVAEEQRVIGACDFSNYVKYSAADLGVTLWLANNSPPPLDSTPLQDPSWPLVAVRLRNPTSHMNLARHSISSTSPIQILDARFDPDCRIFTSATPAGFAVYQTWPLKLLRKRGKPAGPPFFAP